MKKMNLKMSAVIAAVAVMAAGCSSMNGEKKSLLGEKAVEDAKRLSSPTPALGSRQSTQASFTMSNNAFLTSAKTGASQRIVEEKALPSSFSLPYAMRYGSSPVSMARVFRDLETDLQMPVRLSPDVFQTTQTGVAGAAGVAGAPGGFVAPQAMAQPYGAAPYGQQAGNLYQQQQFQGVNLLPPMELNVSGTRKDVLKTIASKLGLEFDYVDGEVVFSKFINRTFYLEGSPRPITSSDSFGSTSTASGSAGSSSSSGSTSSNLSIESAVKAFDDLEAQLKAIKSPAGQIVMSRSQNTVLVRDTKAVMDEAASIIDKHNSMMSRQVHIQLEIISFTMDKAKSEGFDLGLVFQAYTAGLPDASIKLSGPSSLVTGGSALIFALQAGEGGTANPRPANGTRLLVEALNKVGSAHTVHKGEGYSRNNTPQTFNKQKQRSYIDQVTPAPAGATSTTGGTPGITQATVTTGFLSRIYPTILSGNRVLLDTVLSLSNLDNLVEASNGSSKVQSPEVSRDTAVNGVILPSGSYLAFQAYEREVNQDTNQTGILSFSRSATTQIERTIIVMRATVLSTD